MVVKLMPSDRQAWSQGPQQAYATVEFKAAQADDGKRTFTGIATTPTPDRMDDIVEPTGAQFKLPLPLLWQHDACQPIGWVTGAKVTSKSIEIVGDVADVPNDGPLKVFLADAWQALVAGLVRGLSIGFRPIEYSQIEGSWAYRFITWDWYELSAVTVPANTDCSINAIKSADLRVRAALGLPRPGVVRLGDPPGASGRHLRQGRN